MYVPQHFAMTDDAVRALLGTPSAGDLVTRGPDGMEATHLPFAYDPAAGPRGTLIAHMGRINPQWWNADGEAMVILGGPEAYVPSETMRTSPEGPAPTPTWDYVTVHAYGDLTVRTKPEEIVPGLIRLTEVFGTAYHDRFRAADMDEATMGRMLRSIVGIEIRLTHWVAKAKMSQNKPPQVVEHIADEVGEDVATWLRHYSLPRARAKQRVTEGIAARRASRPDDRIAR